MSAESIPDPSVLWLKTTLDGAVMQDKPAKNMIFSVAEIVSYLSVVSPNFECSVEITS